MLCGTFVAVWTGGHLPYFLAVDWAIDGIFILDMGLNFRERRGARARVRGVGCPHPALGPMRTPWPSSAHMLPRRRNRQAWASTNGRRRR